MKPSIDTGNATSHDRTAVVSALCQDFKIPVESEGRLLDTLAYCNSKRFNIPYAAGFALTLQRPFGSELRALVNSPELTPERLYSLDHVTCNEAGLLELVDRVGAVGMFNALSTALGKNADALNIRDMPERISPVTPDDALPLVREALANFVNDAVGMEASAKKDFEQKRGVVLAVPGRMADFLMRALTIAGWNYTAADVSSNYNVVLLKRGWERRPHGSRRPSRDALS